MAHGKNTYWSTLRFNTRPIFFNIHMCDIFFVAELIDIASYADDTTPYVCLEGMDLII